MGGDDNRTQTITLALAELFCRLQASTSPVTTSALTKSFGWTSADVFVQHDAQEFCRLLFEALETQMKVSESV